MWFHVKLCLDIYLQLLLKYNVNELVEKALFKEIIYSENSVYEWENISSHLCSCRVIPKIFKERLCMPIVSFDMNSDRINMVIVDKQGIIRDVKTEWYSEVTSHGFPRNKANAIRLQALAKLLNYAYHHNVGVVVFEDLYKIKKRKYIRKANRKISRFPKRKLLKHAIVMALKYGFKVYLVDPSYTSKIGEMLGKDLGLDRHVASAYMLALKTLQPQVFKILKSYYRENLCAQISE